MGQPPNRIDQIKGAVVATTATILLGTLAAQIGGILALPGRVTTLEERSRDGALARGAVEGRVRTLEDDNRDQKAQIQALQSSQQALVTKLDAFMDEQRRLFQQQSADLVRIQTTLENIRGASGPVLPREDAPGARSRVSR